MKLDQTRSLENQTDEESGSLEQVNRISKIKADASALNNSSELLKHLNST